MFTEGVSVRLGRGFLLFFVGLNPRRKLWGYGDKDAESNVIFSQWRFQIP